MDQYEYVIFDELVMASYYSDKKEDCLAAAQQVLEFLTKPQGPVSVSESESLRLLENTKWAIKKYLEADSEEVSEMSPQQALEFIRGADE